MAYVKAHNVSALCRTQKCVAIPLAVHVSVARVRVSVAVLRVSACACMSARRENERGKKRKSRETQQRARPACTRAQANERATLGTGARSSIAATTLVKNSLEEKNRPVELINSVIERVE